MHCSLSKARENCNKCRAGHLANNVTNLCLWSIVQLSCSTCWIEPESFKRWVQLCPTAEKPYHYKYDKRLQKLKVNC